MSFLPTCRVSFQQTISCSILSAVWQLLAQHSQQCCVFISASAVCAEVSFIYFGFSGSVSKRCIGRFNKCDGCFVIARPLEGPYIQMRNWLWNVVSFLRCRDQNIFIMEACASCHIGKVKVLVSGSWILHCLIQTGQNLDVLITFMLSVQALVVGFWP